jgi:catechol 2,3-dioxygenase-like lactoylglutathione lyase family enzyme
MIIDHIALAVGDFRKSKRFLHKALAPLGIELIVDEERNAGFGKSGKPEFWLASDAGKHLPMHIAFAADNREQVKAFHTAALAAGGLDNGAPGIRAKYHANYYGAFVIDPDGHNVEAVCHRPAA